MMKLEEGDMRVYAACMAAQVSCVRNSTTDLSDWGQRALAPAGLFVIENRSLKERSHAESPHSFMTCTQRSHLLASKILADLAQHSRFFTAL